MKSLALISLMFAMAAICLASEVEQVASGYDGSKSGYSSVTNSTQNEPDLQSSDNPATTEKQSDETGDMKPMETPNIEHNPVVEIVDNKTPDQYQPDAEKLGYKNEESGTATSNDSPPGNGGYHEAAPSDNGGYQQEAPADNGGYHEESPANNSGYHEEAPASSDEDQEEAQEASNHESVGTYPSSTEDVDSAIATENVPMPTGFIPDPENPVTPSVTVDVTYNGQKHPCSVSTDLIQGNTTQCSDQEGLTEPTNANDITGKFCFSVRAQISKFPGCEGAANGGALTGQVATDANTPHSTGSRGLTAVQYNFSERSAVVSFRTSYTLAIYLAPTFFAFAM